MICHNTVVMDKAKKGIRFSEEHKEKLRQAHLGKPLSKECRENMSKSRKGKPLSQKRLDQLKRLQEYNRQQRILKNSLDFIK